MSSNIKVIRGIREKRLYCFWAAHLKRPNLEMRLSLDCNHQSCKATYRKFSKSMMRQKIKVGRGERGEGPEEPKLKNYFETSKLG